MVSNIDETVERALKLGRQYKTTYLLVVDFVFLLVTVFTSDYLAR